MQALDSLYISVTGVTPDAKSHPVVVAKIPSPSKPSVVIDFELSLENTYGSTITSDEL